MVLKNINLLVVLLVAVCMAWAAVGSDAYPNKPVRLVTGEAGGGPDLVARLTAEGIAGALGQAVIVENRAGGVTPPDTVAKANPDGYTLLVSSGIVWLMPYLMQKVPFDPARDFAPVSLAIRAPNVVVVHPSLAVKSIPDLIALAKSKPGALNYASAPTGSASHLAAELFKNMAGVDIVRVPYRGGGPALNDLLSGRVQLFFATPAAVIQHIKSGKLRALAVGSAQPSPLFPGLPTVASFGLRGYESGVMTGVFAPAKTPAPVVARLAHEVSRTFSSPEMKERMLNTGLESVGSSPQEFAAIIKSDIAVWSKLIKDAGIRAE
jgi:tripartite-type tricarboxylate transporter receptor subunit TctC